MTTTAPATGRHGVAGLTRRVPRAAWLALAAAIVTVATWPLTTLAPGTGIDQSWRVALHVAAQRRMEWGPDLDFTFGPLGFLEVPQLVGATTGTLAVLYLLVLQFGLALTIITAADRSIGWAAGVVVAYLVGTFAIESRETLGLIVFVWSCLAIQGAVTPRAARLLPYVGGAVVALALLTKVNVGITCAILAAVAMWWQPPGRWRALALYAGSFVVSFLVLWVAVVGPPWAIPSWAVRSGELAAGFSDGFLVAGPGRGWEFPAFGLLVAALFYCAWQYGPWLERPRALAFALVGALCAFASFKHGFVRHDYAHIWYTMIALLVAPVAVVWRGLAGRVAAAGLLVAAFLVMWHSYTMGPFTNPEILFDPDERLAHFAEQAETLARPSRRDEAQAAARAAMVSDLEVPPAMIARIGDGTVHVDPYETSAVWAYGLRWRPVPVFQAYAAYTHGVDHLNAESLRGGNAPEWILRETTDRIEQRSRETESPAYTVALLCEYSQRMISGRWQLLRRTPGRCGPDRPLETFSADAGELVRVPAAPASDDMVLARFTLRSPLAQRLRTALYRPRTQPRLVLNDDYSGVFAASLAPGPFLIRMADTQGFDDYTQGFTGRSLRLVGVASPYTVSFSSVTVAPPPVGSLPAG